MAQWNFDSFSFSLCIDRDSNMWTRDKTTNRAERSDFSSYQSIVIERIEKNAQTFPLVIRTEDRTFNTGLFSKPNRLKINMSKWKQLFDRWSFSRLTIPSAPTRPRPVIRNFNSKSQLSAVNGVLLQIRPFWLRIDGVTRTWSSVAIAPEEEDKSRKIQSIFNSLPPVVQNGTEPSLKETWGPRNDNLYSNFLANWGLIIDGSV